MTVAAMANPDQGIRVVAPHINLSEATGPGVTTFAVFPLGCGSPIAGFGDGTVAVFDGDIQALTKLDATPIVGAADVDGASVLVGTDGGSLLSISPKGDVTELLTTEGDWVGQVVVHPESLCRACAFGKIVVVFDKDGTELARFDDHDSTVAGLAFSKDGTQIACAHYEAVSVHHIDKPTRRVERLDWHGSHTLVTWSPDGKFIVTAMQENEMHCWRMPEGKGMRMSGYPTKIRALSWTADGKYLAASGANTVTSWSFAGKGPAGKAPTEFGYVYNETVTSVATHPSNHDVAGGYSDGTVLIGFIEKETASIARPGGGTKVTCMSWSSDGSALVAGTEAGELALCKINLAAMI